MLNMFTRSVTVVFLILCLSSVLATNSSCATWHYYSNSSHNCKCGSNLYCLAQDVVEIKQGYCATSAGYKDHYYIGMCVFLHMVNSTNRLFSEMPGDPSELDDVTCGHYNRKGLLCGECFDGFGPAIYSLDLRCANCSALPTIYAVVAYVLLELVPITVFFICIIIFRFTITSGPLLGYLLFCQIFTFVAEGNIVTYSIASHVSLNYRIFYHISLTLCRFWTMHWFFKSLVPPFCLSQKLTGIHIQMLRFLPVTFSVVLVIFTCILLELRSKEGSIVRNVCRPFNCIFNRTNLVTSDAIFHAFASLIFLSHSTVLYVSVTLMLTIPAFYYDGSLYKNTVALDSTIEWLSKEHVVYILIAAVPFVFLTLIPSVILCIYPTRLYRFFSQFISARKRLAITAFAEALHSHFKDGLNGTRDYRALAGLIPFLIIPYGGVVMLLHICGYGTGLATALYCVLVAFMALYIRPCKSVISNVSIAFHYNLFGVLIIVGHLWYNEIDTVDTETLELTLIFIPLISHFLMFLWVGYKIVHFIMVHFNGCCEWKVVLTDISSGTKRYFCCRRSYQYQWLS